MITTVEPLVTQCRATDGTLHVELIGRWNTRDRDQSNELLRQLAQVSLSGACWDLIQHRDLASPAATW